MGFSQKMTSWMSYKEVTRWVGKSSSAIKLVFRAVHQKYCDNPSRISFNWPYRYTFEIADRMTLIWVNGYGSENLSVQTFQRFTREKSVFALQ